MLINGERSLAYIAKITEINPIPNYDKVEYATINGGWRVIVSKSDSFKVGDECIYIEVDSKVPENDERFAFLAKRNFRVKTLKMCTVISQGLVCPKSLFPEVSKCQLGDDVGKILNICYYEPSDNERKGYSTRSSFEDSFKVKHPKLYKSKFIKWLMRKKFGRKILEKLFKKKADKKEFPKFVSKTDEERIENMAWLLEKDYEYVLTEKLDGTSSTYALERKPFGRFEFYVCSRNVRQVNDKQECFHDYNIYWAMAKKYKIEEHLKQFLKQNPTVKWVCIQGESVGGVQGNPLKLEEDDLYCFNFIDSQQGRWDSRAGKLLIEKWGMKWVPILGVGKLQSTMEEVKQFAHGKSDINKYVWREGIVYRNSMYNISFKNVDRDYLLYGSTMDKKGK